MGACLVEMSYIGLLVTVVISLVTDTDPMLLLLFFRMCYACKILFSLNSCMVTHAQYTMRA